MSVSSINTIPVQVQKCCEKSRWVEDLSAAAETGATAGS